MGEREILRELAKRWADIAGLPEMAERKRLWRAVKDLKAERPMILVETNSIGGFFDDRKLLCTDPFLRSVEKTMRETIEHFEDVEDDIVLEPYYRLPWKLLRPDYGMPLIERHAKDTSGGELGYTYDFPIKAPEDVKKLKKRSFGVDRKFTMDSKDKLESIFGDVLPVRVGNYDNFSNDTGYAPFTGNNFIGISMDTYKLMGNDRFIYWLYDHPDELLAVVEYMCDDRIAFFKWMEAEKLLDYNTDNQCAGPSSYGYVSALPDAGRAEAPKLKDVWGWPESQETTVMSPDMFNHFYLKYIAKVSELFGMTYYGCCEPLCDRFRLIAKAIPNLRAVSVSGWNDYYKMGEMLGDRYVYSRKPTPSFMSGVNADWESLKKDMASTYEAAKDCNLEIIFRDIYDINNDRDRIRKWVRMTKAIMNF